jgi:hypothetical protein
VIVVAVRWYLRFIPERGGVGQPPLGQGICDWSVLVPGSV